MAMLIDVSGETGRGDPLLIRVAARWGAPAAGRYSSSLLLASSSEKSALPVNRSASPVILNFPLATTLPLTSTVSSSCLLTPTSLRSSVKFDSSAVWPRWSRYC